MCGIVGAITKRDSVGILLEGLKRLEYRGYDSAGIAMLNGTKINRCRVKGKVQALVNDATENCLEGAVGIAHTRWATHGKPNVVNAHPHISGDEIAVVHNGIIENHETIRKQHEAQGVIYLSDTDTEVIAHQIKTRVDAGKDLLSAVQESVAKLKGAYGIGVISSGAPERLIAARQGSPLIIGLGQEGNYIASDISALLSVTRKFIILQDGDVADISREQIVIYDKKGNKVERDIHTSSMTIGNIDKGKYSHYMLKEIYEQPDAIADTLEGRISKNTVLPGIFGVGSSEVFKSIERVQIIACGTSYNAGAVAKYWFEEILNMPCNAEVASEYRYRKPVEEADTLFVSISQSGETADTLAAIKNVKNNPKLTICNVAESSLLRESDFQLLTHAGPEIGVASTKAFTTQLVALLLLLLAIGKAKGSISEEQENEIVQELRELPRKVEDILQLDTEIKELAKHFTDKQNALFLGRGVMYPIAQEGALKLKEISYIHAESYPAGELKHGPLALIDESMPVVAVAPDDDLMGKLQSNLEVVSARGGQLYVIADHGSIYQNYENINLLVTNVKTNITCPIVFTVPLQLLAYHVALVKGTDIDQPRNLAKSVTVE